MALVTTVTPTVSTADHVPGIPDDGDGNIAGEFDLGTVAAWGYVASFASPQGLAFGYDPAGPTLDIGQGRVYRTGDENQRVVTVESVSGISLNSDTEHFVYFNADDEYEIRDADEPPGDKALLVGYVDTETDTVRDGVGVRGRNPVSQFSGDGPGGDTECCAPLAVQTLEATAIADTEARLNGRLEGLGGADSAQVFFHYREASASSWTKTTETKLVEPGEFDVVLSGLTADTQYIYRAVVTAGGETAQGGEVTFTTTNDGTTNPAVSTDAATNVGTDGATLNGELTSLGSYSSADVYFQYRQNGSAVWSSTARTSQASTGTFSETANGLRESTTYQYRAVAETSAGAVTGSTVEFTTGAGAGLAVTTDAASGVTDSDATMNGTLDSLGPNADSSPGFEFRESGSSVWRERQAGIFTTAPQTYDYTLTTLDAGTQYEYRAFATGDYGSESTGATQTFTTDVAGEVIDDFEDGDITVKNNNWSGWSGDTGSLSNVGGEAEFTVTDDIKSVTATRSAAGQFTGAELTAEIDSQGSEGDPHLTYAPKQSGTDLFALRFEGDGDIQIGATSIGSWSTNTRYKIQVSSIDYSANTFDITITETASGTVVASESDHPFTNSASGIDEVLVGSSTPLSGVTNTLTFDDVIVLS